jgi:hypothetical protein
MIAPVRHVGDGFHSFRRATLADGTPVLVDALFRAWDAPRLAGEAARIGALCRTWEAAAQAGNRAAPALLPPLWRAAARVARAQALLGAGPPVHQVSVTGAPAGTVLRCVCGALEHLAATLWSPAWAAAVARFVGAHRPAPPKDDPA